MAAPPEDLQQARVNGVEIAYFDHGQGTPVVFVHGWPQHSHAWRPLTGQLQDRARCIALDLRGCGDSETTASGFDKKTLAADTAALIRQLGLSRVVLAGHDWGAPIAYRLALDNADLVAGLVIFNGRMPLLASHSELMFTPQQVRERWYFNFNLIPELPEIMIGRSLEPFLAHLMRHWSAGRMIHSETDLAEYVRVHDRPDGLRAGLEFYRTAVKEDARDWHEHEGRRIEVPNLVLWGARDPVLPPVYLQRLENVTPDLEVHVHEKAGHFLPEEAPGWCATRIVDFLARRVRG